MKKLFLAIALLISISASAQLTLSEKSKLAEKASFRSRVYQSLFSKANVFLNQTPTNLEWQKKVRFAKSFCSGSASSYDAQVITRLWLANYNIAPTLDANSEPIDSQILDSAGLDVVYNLLAGVIVGDDQLPIQ